MRRAIAYRPMAFALALVAAASLARADEARADETRADEARAGTDAEATLARDRAASRLWYFGWTAIYTASTAANVAVAFAASDPGLRADARVGAVTSGLGLVTTAIMPPPSLLCAPCDGRALEDAAKFERFGHSWLPHLGVVLVNFGAGAFLWFHDDRRVSAVLTTVVGTAVGELQIWTQPTIARDAHAGAASAWSFGVAPASHGAALFAGRAF